MSRKNDQRRFITRIKLACGRSKSFNVSAGGKRSATEKALALATALHGVMLYCRKKDDGNVGQSQFRRWL